MEENETFLTDHNGKHNNVLFFCTVPGSCEEDTSTIGYVVNFKDKTKYIAYKPKTNGENDCDIYETPQIPNEGNPCSVGELYEGEGDTYKLCIDENNLVTVNAVDDTSSYLVDAMTESTFIHKDNVPKGGYYYFIVNIKSKNIILNSKGNFYNTK